MLFCFRDAKVRLNIVFTAVNSTFYLCPVCSAAIKTTRMEKCLFWTISKRYVGIWCVQPLQSFQLLLCCFASRTFFLTVYYLHQSHLLFQHTRLFAGFLTASIWVRTFVLRKLTSI